MRRDLPLAIVLRGQGKLNAFLQGLALDCGIAVPYGA